MQRKQGMEEKISYLLPELPRNLYVGENFRIRWQCRPISTQINALSCPCRPENEDLCRSGSKGVSRKLLVEAA